MDAMIDRMTLQLLARAGEIAGRKDIPVLQCLPMMIKALHLRADWNGFYRWNRAACGRPCFLFSEGGRRLLISSEIREQELFLYFFGYRLTDDLPPQLWRFFCGDGRWGDERHTKGRNKGAASIKRMRLCYDKPIKKTINTITGST